MANIEGPRIDDDGGQSDGGANGQGGSRSVVKVIRESGNDKGFEPTTSDPEKYNETTAMPGTRAKLIEMGERVRKGLPIWHPDDANEAPGGSVAMRDGLIEGSHR